MQPKPGTLRAREQEITRTPGALGQHGRRCAVTGVLWLVLLACLVGCPGQTPGRARAVSPALAAAPSPQSLTPSQAQRMYNWLIVQTYRNTGLVESFSRTADPCLRHQASTYDQAIAGIMACLVGDCEMAGHILAFFQEKWITEGPGFANFYNTINGRVEFESTMHAGPTLWIALLALQYEALTGSRRYRPLALEIARWAAALPHHGGGIAMGPRDETRAPWTRIVATEHNLDYYAVLQALEARVETEAGRRWLQRELQEVEAFLNQVVYDRLTGGIHRGFQAPETVDRTRALDTVTWSLAAMGPATLRRWGIDPERLLRFAEAHFRVTVHGLEGFDFTDAAGARQAGRERMISLEWTGQMVNAYLLVARDLLEQFGETGDPRARERARAYQARAQRLMAAMDEQAIQETTTLTYPYATLPNALVFADGWRTPQPGQDGGLGGSVAATAWRLFAGSFNPLQPDDWLGSQRLPSVRKRQVHPHPHMAGGALFPASRCTSAGLTNAAWKNLEAGRFGTALAYAEEAIRSYGKEAARQQSAKAKKACLMRYRKGDNAAKHRILTYAALNDVAAALFIKGKIHAMRSQQARGEGDVDEARRQEAQAKAAFEELVDAFACAQVWNPRGWFWSPAQAAPREYPALIEKGHESPSQVFARGGVVAVYTDKDAPDNHFIPSGWMGDRGDIDFDDASTITPSAGRTCIRLGYSAQGSHGEGWAGIYWQYPEQNWGDKPQGYDLTGAQRLVFRARGEHGGERAEFKVGGIRGRYPDSIRLPRSTGVLTLTREWQRYEIPLADLDLTHVIGGFVWVTNRQSNPRGSTIYVDEIRFEGSGLSGR
jgi:hypothetical protein